jgi:hypothetical protein
MDAPTFDALSRAFVLAGTRRRLLALLRFVPLTGPLAALHGEATAAKGGRQRRRRRADHRQHLHDAKKKKKKCARAGQLTNKKRKQCCAGLINDGSGLCVAPSSPPPPCVLRTCPANACGSVPDGCGGTLQCGACAGNQLCHDGSCHACTVTCLSGVAATCGADLQLALDSGGTVYVCPGRYRPPTADGFSLDMSVTVVGAGQGTGVGTDTILDAQNSGRVVHIPSGTGTVVLERLRITGANTGAPGGGILHEGGPLRLTDCTVSANTVGAWGGGIWFASASTWELTRCTVRDNEAASTGGGIDVAPGNGTVTLTDCLIEDNQAGTSGGGFQLSGGTTILAGSTQVRGNAALTGGGIQTGFGTGFAGGSLVIAESCRVTQNTASALGNGGGIFQSVPGEVTLLGTHPSPIVVNNCHENCVGTIDGCSTASPNPDFCPS